jgi:hypothetical protein
LKNANLFEEEQVFQLKIMKPCAQENQYPMWVFDYLENLLTCTYNQLPRYSESPCSPHQWSNHIHTDCLKKSINWFSSFFLFCPSISIPVQAHSRPLHFFIFLQSAALWHSQAFSSQIPYLQKHFPGLLLKYVLLLIFPEMELFVLITYRDSLCNSHTASSRDA